MNILSRSYCDSRIPLHSFHHINNIKCFKHCIRCCHIDRNRTCNNQSNLYLAPSEWNSGGWQVAQMSESGLWDMCSVECCLDWCIQIFKKIIKILYQSNKMCLQLNLVCRWLIIPLCSSTFLGKGGGWSHFLSWPLSTSCSQCLESYWPPFNSSDAPWSWRTFYLNIVWILTHWSSEVSAEVSLPLVGLLWPPWAPPIIPYPVAFLCHIYHHVNIYFS